MNINFEKDVRTYTELVEPLLLKNEACNNLMLGILNRIAEGDAPYNDVNFGYVVEDGEVIYAFMQTPPNNWIFPDLDSVTEDVPRKIAAFLHHKKVNVPGVLGPDYLVKPFVEKWGNLHDVTSNIHMRQLVYQLDAVNEVPPASGELVAADEQYHQLISDWLIQFGVEADEPITRQGADKLAAQFFKNRSVYLWMVDGKPVSMVNRSRRTKNGATINAVFTPDAYKRNGYATSSVAALSTKLLKDGVQFCSLYTDEDYPTSNRIYKKIGYYQVGSSVVYEFNRK
ncbi:GNAT family N-acetyltransferase [Virgibacillus phasianinus]|uniref:GNAT family N-acetyltransferase n=1 Tax=Virgibacillus phasianinus TaxID=2017483 RepID=A0A220U1R6_9BACI|nr:GNAT family N-acetyltransferase [Virgibacillus phasianinus]ASK62017.1 GNAT family N-acetyltransferase [Virgibacillus phasianinus]